MRESDASSWRVSAGLLLLRLSASTTLFLVFGLQKLGAAKAHLVDGQPWVFVDFNRRIHFRLPVATAYLQTFNESVLPILVALGLFGRIPAALLGIAFVVATGASSVAHESIVTAATFAIVFVSLGLTGPGAFSLDRLLSRRNRHPSG